MPVCQRIPVLLIFLTIGAFCVCVCVYFVINMNTMQQYSLKKTPTNQNKKPKPKLFAKNYMELVFKTWQYLSQYHSWHEPWHFAGSRLSLGSVGKLFIIVAVISCTSFPQFSRMPMQTYEFVKAFVWEVLESMFSWLINIPWSFCLAA